MATNVEFDFSPTPLPKGSSLDAGDRVKLTVAKGQGVVWVVVTGCQESVAGAMFTGAVDSVSGPTPSGLTMGASVQFRRMHVYEVMRG
jgi:hypothetical protein